MKRIPLQILLFAIALVLSATIHAGSTETDKWDRAAEKITRLSPSEFPKLPRSVRNDLEKQECTIAQTYVTTSPHIVISGAFEKKGQKDWAVLCSSNGVSTIRIYWGDRKKGVTEIESSDDKGWLQGIGNGKIGFSRYIGVANAQYIMEHYQRYGGTKPPHIDHEGINEAVTEKASKVHYLHEGKWLRLTGAD